MFERAKSFILRSRKKESNFDLDESTHLRRTIDAGQIDKSSNPNIYASLRVTTQNTKQDPVQIPYKNPEATQQQQQKTLSLEDVTLRNNTTLTKISRHSLQTNNNQINYLDQPRICPIEPYHRKSTDTIRSSVQGNTSKERRHKINVTNPNIQTRLAYESLEKVKEKKSKEIEEEQSSKSDFLKSRLTRQRTDINITRTKASNKQKRYSGGDFIVLPNNNNNYGNEELNKSNDSIIKNKCELEDTLPKVKKDELIIANKMNLPKKPSPPNEIRTANKIMNKPHVAENLDNSNSLRFYYHPAPKMGTKALLMKGPKNPIIENAKKESLQRDELLLKSVALNQKTTVQNEEFMRSHAVRRSLQETSKKSLPAAQPTKKYLTKSNSFIYKPTKGLQNILQE